MRPELEQPAAAAPGRRPPGTTTLPPVATSADVADAAGGGPSLVRRQNKSPRGARGPLRVEVPRRDGPLQTLCRNMPASKVRIVNLDGEALAMRCKSWACPDCRPWLKRRLRQSIVYATEERPELRRFFTLTMRPGARQLDLRDRYRELNACFSKMCRRIERREGRRMEYLQIREAHKDGTPHIHGLMTRYRSHRQLKADWRAVGGGSVDIRLVDPHRVAAYISKYLVKDDQVLPKGCRKYGSGGGVRLYSVRPPGGGGEWRPQVAGTDLQGRPAWLEVYTLGPYMTWVQHGLALGALGRSMAQRELGVELDTLAARVGEASCVVCGGLHEIHPMAVSA